MFFNSQIAWHKLHDKYLNRLCYMYITTYLFTNRWCGQIIFVSEHQRFHLTLALRELTNRITRKCVHTMNCHGPRKLPTTIMSTLQLEIKISQINVASNLPNENTLIFEVYLVKQEERKSCYRSNSNKWKTQ